jgi:hypothetical protein
VSRAAAEFHLPLEIFSTPRSVPPSPSLSPPTVVGATEAVSLLSSVDRQFFSLPHEFPQLLVLAGCGFVLPPLFSLVIAPGASGTRA